MFRKNLIKFRFFYLNHKGKIKVSIVNVITTAVLTKISLKRYNWASNNYCYET